MWFYLIWLLASYILGVLYATGFTSVKYIKYQDWEEIEKTTARRKAITLIVIGLAGVIAIGVYGTMEKGWLFILLLLLIQAYNLYSQKKHVQKKREQHRKEDEAELAKKED